MTVSLDDLLFRERNAHAGGGMSIGLHHVEFREESWLFKEYRDEVVASGPDLTAAVAWRHSLTQDQRRRLDETCAFPHAIVTDRAGALAGILMREAPTDFLTPGAGRATTRTFDTMGLPKAVAERQGVDYVEPPIRIAVMGRLAELLAFLHGIGVVVGDLNAKNILVTTTPGNIQVFLVDCDSMIVAGRTAFISHDPPFLRCPWVPPGTFNRETDWYKFAMLAIRLLAGSQAVNVIDRARLAGLMRTTDLDLLEDMTLPDRTPTDAEVVGISSDWATRAGNSGQLWVKDDQGTRRWHGGVDRPPSEPVGVSAVSTGPPQKPPVRAKAPQRRSRNAPTNSGRTLAVGLAAALAVAAVVVLGWEHVDFRSGDKHRPLPAPNAANAKLLAKYGWEDTEASDSPLVVSAPEVRWQLGVLTATVSVIRIGKGSESETISWGCRKADHSGQPTIYLMVSGPNSDATYFRSNAALSGQLTSWGAKTWEAGTLQAIPAACSIRRGTKSRRWPPGTPISVAAKREWTANSAQPWSATFVLPAHGRKPESGNAYAGQIYGVEIITQNHRVLTHAYSGTGSSNH